GIGTEHPSAVAFGDGVDETLQARFVAEQEEVERRAVPGEVIYLDERRYNRLPQRWIPEQWPIRRVVRCGLAVGDDEDHRLGVGVLAQMPTGQAQGLLQVRALLLAWRDRGELGLAQHRRGQAESDDLERVLRELGGHQVRQRECRLLHRAP